MSGNSVQQLSQRLAQRQLEDKQLAEQQSAKLLAEHEQSLRSESQRAVGTIRDGTKRLSDQVQSWSDQLTEAQQKTAEQLTLHVERLKTSTTDAQNELNHVLARSRDESKRILARSIVPLAVIWALALAGLLAALAALWYADRQWERIQTLRASMTALEAFQGAQVVEDQGKTYLVAPSLGRPFRTGDARTAVEINPK